jgi:4-hydroxybenzoate polyprenyltransferase
MLKTARLYTFIPSILQSSLVQSSVGLAVVKCLSQLRYECVLNWRFVRRDMLVSVVPGILFSIAALINYPVASGLDLLGILLKGVVYFWLCITTFCISSQLVGIDEDRLNKPDRPLVTGFVTPDGARWRWVVASIVLTLFAIWTRTIGWAMIWQVGCWLYDYAGGSKHWYAKTFLGGMGVTSEIGAAWQLVERTIPPLVWCWVGVIGLYLITLMAVQDFRDVAGDRAQGRRTMPIVFDEVWCRYGVAVGYLLFPLVVHFCLMRPVGLTLMVWVWDLGLALMAWVIGLRTVLLRTPAADHRTYVGFTVLLCAYLLCAVFVLRV